jgi:hypothetical protein
MYFDGIHPLHYPFLIFLILISTPRMLSVQFYKMKLHSSHITEEGLSFRVSNIDTAFIMSSNYL